MRKLLASIAIAVLFSVSALGQNLTTVSASNITDLNQNKLAAGQLCFLITDQSDNPISVSIGGGGQSLRRGYCSAVAAGVATSFTVPNPANTQPSGIYYRVTVKDSSTGQEVLRYTQVSFTGGTFNFDNYAPLNLGTPAPISGNSVTGNLSVTGNIAATGTISASNIPATIMDLTSNQTAAGNKTFTGNTSLSCLLQNANYQYAFCQSGVDAGAKITNCMGALAATGGICDARPFGATVQAISSCPLNIGSSTKHVSLLVDPSTRYNVSCTGAPDSIKVFNASRLDCGDGVGSLGTAGNSGGGFWLTSSANVNTLITNGQQDGTQEFVSIIGCTFAGNPTATVAKSVAYFNQVFVPSVITGNTFLGLANAPTVWLDGGGGTLKWDNNWVNAATGNSCTAKTMVGIKITGSIDVDITHGAAEHACNAPLMLIDGTTGFSSPANPIVRIKHYHFETQTGSCNGIEATDAKGLTVEDVNITGVSNGGCPDFLKITKVNSTGGIAIKQVHNLIGTYTNTVNDTVHSIVLPKTYEDEWKYPEDQAAAANQSELMIGDFGFHWTSSGTLHLGKFSASGPSGPTLLGIRNSATFADYASLGWSGDNQFRLTVNNGRGLVFSVNAAGDAWRIANNANPALQAITDGVGDIGASGSGRPNNIYAKNSVVINGLTGTVSIGSGTVTTAGTAVANGTCQAQTGITVTGAAATDVAHCSLNAAAPATWQTGIFLAIPEVTSNTVTVRLCNGTAASITPAATTVRCTVTR